ncbi:MAG: ferredoxin [Bacteroidetes bacterium GWF2_33_16]|nr:MAG: ferredoxin [Bacteroidetes bacterium GWE2_32_14]OFY06537.1 MAG: ferredoxin [Bacteroidetes bacterium GWF2_33_16]
MVNIEVNNQQIQAKEGETILDTLNRNGIKVPTLCRMEGFSPTGACRLCVVEIEGKPGLIPSCSFHVEESLKIKTHSPRVIRSRKMLVELLLSNHPDDCLYCVRNGNCELQDLAVELNIRERRISGNKSKANLDQSSPGIVHDPAKCVLCGRCVRVCEEIQSVSTFDFIKRGNKTAIATTMNKDLNFSNCVHCGQCIMVCPTGALHEKINFDVLLEMLNKKDSKVIVQYSPTIAISVAEDLGIRSGKDISGLINAALRKIGFFKVFDTTFGSDLLIYEQSAELLDRIKYDNGLPLISSCCPGWIKYMEQSHFDLMENVSTCKSAQQMMGTLIKGYFAQEEKISPEKIFSVSIMPCTAKKFEAQREEMTHKGISDIDLVLTSRELVKLINLCGIDVQQLQEEMADNPFNTRSSAGKLVSVSGGMAEAIIRTTHFLYSKKEMPEYKITKLRGTKERREMNIQIGDLNLGIAVVSGLKNAKNLLEEIRNGRKDLHYIEIMACPGGCINGGGQPFCSDEKVMKGRAKAVYDLDEKDGLKVAHKNPAIIRLYEKFLEEPLSVKANSLLHTRYSERDVLL